MDSGVKLGFGVALSVLAAIGGYSYYTAVSFTRASSQEVDSQQMIREIKNTYAILQDAETAQRGYLLTGRSEMLDPYFYAKREMPLRLDNLEALTADQPESRVRLRILRPWVEKRLQQLGELAQLFKDGRRDEAVLRMSSEDNQKSAWRIRRFFDTLETLGGGEFVFSGDELRAGALSSTRLIALGSLLGFLLVFIAMFVVSQEIVERRRVSERLQQLNSAFLSFGPDPERNIDALIRASGFVLRAQAVSYWRRRDEGMACVASWSASVMAGALAHVPEVVELIEDRPTWMRNPPEAESLGWRACYRYPIVSGRRIVGYLVAYFADENASSSDNSEFVGIVGAALAVEERRQASQTELVGAREAAIHAAHVKNEFVANISHELRTPINGLIGMSALMLRTPLSPEQTDYLETFYRSAEGLLGLVNDVLDFSKIEANKVSLERIPFDPRSLVVDVTRLFSGEFTAKGLSFSTLGLEALPAGVAGDPVRIRQVLTNLLSNALKFTAQGGVRLHVTVAERRQAATEDSSAATDFTPVYIRFELQDTGIGIPVGALGKIFEPFEQADSSTTRRFGGTGLGLSISKRLVAAMSGQFGVDSREGEGSTFWFELPLVRTPGEEIRSFPKELTVVKHPGLSARILVAEDNAVNTKVLTRLLEQMGHHVVSAAHGEEAVQWALREEFDLILMDCQMPVLDGYEATRKIRCSQGPKVRIIAVTAHASQVDRQRCLDAGMNDYFIKPFTPAELETRIPQWLSDQFGVTLTGVPEREFATAAVVDHRVWERLVQAMGGSRVILGEMLDAFLDAAFERRRAVMDAVARGDRAELGRRSHALRSSAGALGAQRLSDSCARLEALAPLGTWHAIHDEHRVFDREWETVCAVFFREAALIRAELSQSA